MLFKSLSVVSAFALLASATPIQRSSQITCSQGATHTLQYKFNQNSNVGNAAFNGQRDGQGRQNLVTLASDGSPAEAQSFTFWNCDGANSLGYAKGVHSNGGNYGQLRPANAPHHCVTISDLKSKDARFVSDKCLSNDDENLLTQYFYIAPNGLTINFLGNGNSSSHPDEVYSLSIGDTAHKKIQVNYLGENVNLPEDRVFLGFPNTFV